jgi:hypothetical protein
VEVTGRRDLEDLLRRGACALRVDVLQDVRERAGSTGAQRTAADAVCERQRAPGHIGRSRLVARGQAVDRGGREQERLGGVIAAVRGERGARDAAVGAFGERATRRLRPDPAQTRVLRRIADPREPLPRERTRLREICDEHGAPRRAREQRDVRGMSVDSGQLDRAQREMRPPRALHRQGQAGPGREAGGGVEVAALDRVGIRGVHVVQLDGEPRGRVVLVGTRNERTQYFDLAREVRGVAAPRRGRGLRVEARRREGADRLEQPEPAAGGAGRALQQRLVDELRELVGGREHVGRGDRGGGREIELALERAEHEEQPALFVREELERPVDRVVERQVMCGSLVASRDRHRPSRVELLEDLRGGERASPRRRELERERDAIEPSTQLDDTAQVIGHRSRAFGSFAEQPDRVRRALFVD